MQRHDRRGHRRTRDPERQSRSLEQEDTPRRETPGRKVYGRLCTVKCCTELYCSVLSVHIKNVNAALCTDGCMIRVIFQGFFLLFTHTREFLFVPGALGCSCCKAPLDIALHKALYK